MSPLRKCIDELNLVAPKCLYSSCLYPDSKRASPTAAKCVSLHALRALWCFFMSAHQRCHDFPKVMKWPLRARRGCQWGLPAWFQMASFLFVLPLKRQTQHPQPPLSASLWRTHISPELVCSTFRAWFTAVKKHHWHLKVIDDDEDEVHFAVRFYLHWLLYVVMYSLTFWIQAPLAVKNSWELLSCFLFIVACHCFQFFLFSSSFS